MEALEARPAVPILGHEIASDLPTHLGDLALKGLPHEASVAVEAPRWIGPFCLERRLGAGGMGEVFEAWDRRLRRRVALKRIRSDRAPSSEARRRFLNEARAVAQLNHPAVVQIHDLLRGESHDWIVMELVEGETLAQRLRRGPLELSQTLKLSGEMLEGLEAAHQKGIIHRDLKSENVIVTREGKAKILDFGIARSAAWEEDAFQPTPSPSSKIEGTPKAMSPEQVLGHKVDARSDLFSFGVLLYEMLTGQHPFQSADGLNDTLRRICVAQPEPIREQISDLPEGLSGLVLHLLEKDPMHRPQDAQEVLSRLSAIRVPKLESDSLPPAMSATPLDGPTFVTDQPWSRSEVFGLRLRHFSPPSYPSVPYPLLLPYTHPEMLGGRERELAELLELLELPIPILGVHAASGVGKSSLLAGGLVPTLRGSDCPTALDRHPAEPGLARRLLDDLLLTSDSESQDPTAEAFAARLLELDEHLDRPPVLVLDQLEDVLEPGREASRMQLGLLLAASVVRPPGRKSAPCRWVFAYRQERHGEVMAWLGDLFAGTEEARESNWPGDLSAPGRYHDFPLLPLGTAPPGDEPLAAAVEAFTQAISRPLILQDDSGEKLYPWFLSEASTERLADAFARARLERPDAPLTPEFQTVMAHLIGGTERNEGEIHVPQEVRGMIEEALEAHVRRALENAFPLTHSGFRQARSCALLALRELAIHGSEGLPVEDLSRALDGDERTLNLLAGPRCRLLVLQQQDGRWHYRLAHDQLVDVIRRLVKRETRRDSLKLDGDLIALHRLVALRSALFRSTGELGAPIGRRPFIALREHASVLLWAEDHRAWWQACQRQRRENLRQRAWRAGAGFFVIIILFAFLVSWLDHRQERIEWFEQITAGSATAAFSALDTLRGEQEEPDRLRELVASREDPFDLLERGTSGVPGPRRSSAVLATVELLHPLLLERATDPRALASTVVALDRVIQQDAAFSDAALAWRQRVLTPLRRQIPPPILDEADESWIEIRPKKIDELTPFRIARYEVTRKDFLRLFPSVAEVTATGSSFEEGGRVPIVNVTWYEAYTYAAWLGGRLPTEAEWVYAARARCPHDYCDAAGQPTTMDRVAWYRLTASDLSSLAPELKEVGMLEPNPWGLHDVYGNAWEWVADAVESETQSADGEKARTHLILGGGVWSPTERVGPSARVSWRSGERLEVLGFRMVLPLAPGLPAAEPR